MGKEEFVIDLKQHVVLRAQPNNYTFIMPAILISPSSSQQFMPKSKAEVVQ